LFSWNYFTLLCWCSNKECKINLLILKSNKILINFDTRKKRTDEWQFVFMTSALIYFIGAAVYLFLAEVDTNEWKKEDEN